jgi:hypothetical protein
LWHQDVGQENRLAFYLVEVSEIFPAGRQITFRKPYWIAIARSHYVEPEYQQG